jgi:hypothetical protein
MSLSRFMCWVVEGKYRAKIGGIYYENVLQPIVYNDESLIKIARNKNTGLLGVSFELKTQDKVLIATIENNEIKKVHSEKFSIHKGENRFALVENGNGRIWCDLKFAIKNKEFELDLSCILFGKNGYPIILHPNRSKFGEVNNSKPPNFSLFAIATEYGSQVTAFNVENASVYLLSMKIENFRRGINIVHTQIDQ